MLSDKLGSQLARLDVGASSLIVCLLVILVLVVLADYAHMLYQRSRMPPGPFPWPIVGNTYSLPENKPWIYFEQLSKLYNVPIITFWIGR